MLRGLPPARASKALILPPPPKPSESTEWNDIMLLGDVIARFENEAVLSETLFALDDLALMARIATLAAEDNLSVGEVATHAIGRFVNGASDEEWLTLIGQMSRAEDPGQVFLRHALSSAWLPSRRA